MCSECAGSVDSHYAGVVSLSLLFFLSGGFEDRRALDGGEDGLSVIREVLQAAPSLLKPGGLVTHTCHGMG